jgi:hypothetical protein
VPTLEHGSHAPNGSGRSRDPLPSCAELAPDPDRPDGILEVPSRHTTTGCDATSVSRDLEPAMHRPAPSSKCRSSTLGRSRRDVRLPRPGTTPSGAVWAILKAPVLATAAIACGDGKGRPRDYDRCSRTPLRPRSVLPRADVRANRWGCGLFVARGREQPVDTRCLPRPRVSRGNFGYRRVALLTGFFLSRHILRENAVSELPGRNRSTDEPQTELLR